MPPTASWIVRLPEAIEQLEVMERRTVTRSDLQELFGVSKRTAVNLMHRFGAAPLGNALVLDRELLVKQLRRLQRGQAFDYETRRQAHVLETLRRARIHRVRIPVSPETYGVQMTGLPAGVVVGPGRIEVTFETAREGVQRLFELAQALTNDFDTFEELVKS